MLFEQTYIGPIKLSYIWKFPIIGYMLFYTIKHNANSPIFVVSILLSFKLLLNTHVDFGIGATLTESVYILVFPITFVFCKIFFKDNLNVLKFVTLSLCSFFLLSNIPFQLGILSQQRIIEVFDEKSALTGLFFHMSISSQIFAISTIIILFEYQSFKKKSLISLWILLVTYGTTVTIQAFTRTGWMLLTVGFLMYAFYYFNYKTKVISIIIIFLLISIISVDKNSNMVKRLMGESKNTTNESMNLNTLSSGRLSIFENSINIVKEDGNLSILMGVGKDYLTHQNGQIMGREYVAHNRFIEIFTYGGVIALFIFFIYIIHLLKILLSIHSRFRPLPVTLFIIYIITLFPSHGFNIYSDFLFASIMSFYSMSSISIKRTIKYNSINYEKF
jgi:O-antigen ligase